MKRFRLVNMDTISSVAVAGMRAYFNSFTTSLFPKKQFMFIAAILCSVSIVAQQNNAPATDTAYQKVLADRTAKIVNTLNISDAALYNNVQQQLVDQYAQVNSIQDGNKTAVAAIKAKQLSKEETEAAVKNEEARKATSLQNLHQKFIAQLKLVLTEAQIEKLKDGMTYSILPVTWKAYQEMLPQLTSEQKDKMYTWLLEARELAMDEGSSDKKHAVFGKYKGRINNYLSAAGYDMKKEGEEWQKRIQAAKETQQTQN